MTIRVLPKTLSYDSCLVIGTFPPPRYYRDSNTETVHALYLAQSIGIFFRHSEPTFIGIRLLHHLLSSYPHLNFTSFALRLALVHCGFMACMARVWWGRLEIRGDHSGCNGELMNEYLGHSWGDTCRITLVLSLAG